MSKPKLSPVEGQILEDALKAECRLSEIRLREGEYQYDLARTIAAFQLELYFPNVKDIIDRLYGKEKTDDIQFVRKIQTILKKMEKSNVIKILPKKKPWALQRYVLLSFKFQDIDKNLIVLATDEQIKQTLVMLHFTNKDVIHSESIHTRMEVYILCIAVIVLYLVSMWALLQSNMLLIVFIPAFSLAIICSLLLGNFLSRYK